jgi:hypothetical protein
MEYLKRDELEVGATYKVEARNFYEAVWNGSVFKGTRVKFGDRFGAVEYHWDDGVPNGTVKPLNKIEKDFK